jgi:hypothetical protein
MFFFLVMVMPLLGCEICLSGYFNKKEQIFRLNLCYTQCVSSEDGTIGQSHKHKLANNARSAKSTVPLFGVMSNAGF